MQIGIYQKTGSPPDKWAEHLSSWLPRYDEAKQLQIVTDQIRSFEAQTPVIRKDEVSSDFVPLLSRDYKFSQPNPDWFTAWRTGAIVMSPYVRLRSNTRFHIVEREHSTYERKAFGSPSSISAYGGIYRVVGEGQRLVSQSKELIYLTPKSPIYLAMQQQGMLMLGQPDYDPVDMWTALMAKSNSAAYDLATELAELSETATWLRGLLPRIRDALYRLRTLYSYMRAPAGDLSRLRRLARKKGKRFDPGKVPDPLKKASAYWLEYTYAIRPLMLSVADAIRASAMDGRYFQRFRERTLWEREADFDYGGFTCHFRRQFTARAMVRQSINASSARAKVQLWVPTAAWEVVPYSFVVDWFVGIGDYLAALRPFAGDARSFSWSILDTQAHNIIFTSANEEESPAPVPSPFPDYTGRWWSGIQHTAQRTRYGSVVEHEELKYHRASPCSPVIGVSVRVNLSWQREVSATALSYQQLSKLR